MNLEPGTRLGPYEILAPIGAGGMGEVYRARDSRLERMVAIKILPRQFAADARLRLRFEREAKVISALNHPHICAVYDVGQSGGNNPVSYIVMEYVDGETLAAILARGPLPVDEAIRFALQIAGALDKAHRQGIVHRDLKPANVMITRSGAKLLDFGLARSSDNAPVTESRGTDVMTEQGQVMGTLQYMAPEQLEGKQADGRADIFAFGAVVYEMLTGKRAFDRETRGGVMTAILSGDVRAPSAERTEVPAALDQIVLLCLTKSADERWQSAHDLKLALESLTGVAPARREGIRTRRWPWLALGTALIAAAFFGGRVMRGVKPADAVRFEILPPGGAPFTPTENSSSTLQFAVSPNGRLIVFVAGAAAGPGKLWLRTVDDVEAHPMEGTSGATFPFWSPDSRSVGFFADRKLKIAALSGGAPEALADAPDSRGGTWAPDGTILFAPSLAGPLYRVAATGGGNATPATNLDRSRGERGHRWPQFFPHSSRFLFLNMCGRVEDQGIYVGSLDSPDRQMLLKSNLRAEFAAGHLFFLRGGTLWAQALDPAALKLIGQPFQVAQGVGYAAGVRYGSFSVSDAATLAYVVAPGGAIRRLQWFDRKGQPMAAITQPADWRVSSVSSDDQKVLASDNDPVTGNRAIFMLDAVRGTSTRLTYNPVGDSGGYWSPDGTQIAFNSARAGAPDIYLKSATGRGS
ncbi:MAG: protein kinase domain-containing protein, partial [Thermoanaerobaculia bacterium]